MGTLIIAEKPKVAKRIASSLGTPKRKKLKDVYYYTLGELVVASTVGHLYTLRQREGKSYPVFDLEWVETSKVSTESEYLKKYISTLKKLSENVDLVINACDYDVEGAVIGYNAIRFTCRFDPQKAKRMKFSILTSEEIKKAFENLEDLNFGMIDAGLARHEMDWIWGVNTSRALTSSLKRASGWYKILSAGRVQTPTLKFLMERELEIRNFVPETYWILQIFFEKDGISVVAEYPERIFEKKRAERIYNECLGKDGIVKDIERKVKKVPPPVPFDLGTLQREAFKAFSFAPRRTQKISQELYESGLISYPRTASQKLPPSLGFEKILENISKNPRYRQFAKEILKTPLQPSEGKKTDPAHPAIYPTGEFWGKLTKDQEKLYDLVVLRFFSVFAEPCVQESVKLLIEVEGNPFIAKGLKTLKEGFKRYYKRYLKEKEIHLPEFEIGERIKIDDLKMPQKQTKPPPRYNPSSVIKKMENLEIGTKATRASILDILYQRGYIRGRKIMVTKLGEKLIEALNLYCREIVSAELTKHFEDEMREIREYKKSREEVLKEARAQLEEIFSKFKNSEYEIGKIVQKGFLEENAVGVCPECGENLLIRYAKRNKSYFIGCRGYPECRNTYSLPKGKPVFEGKFCDVCNLPMVRISRREVCINPKCPKLAKSEVLGKCAQCGGDLRIIRSRSSGKRFVGCSNYPRCKNTFPIPQRGKLTPMGECDACGAPVVETGSSKFCINPNCKKNVKSQMVFGRCPKCGGDLKKMYSKKFKREFVGCTGFPKCKNAFSLPKGKVEPTDEVCRCGLPLLLIDGVLRCLDSECEEG
ncbi:MAG: DNA topoisomerase I [Candidatus Methanofastidiosia archaeon]